MNKVAMLARCVHASVQKHGNSLTKANLATAAARCHICHHQRPKLSPRCSTIHWGDQPAIHWRASSMGKKRHFVLIGVDTYSGYAFAFPIHDPSGQTTIFDLIKWLIHCHGILHSMSSDQETHFTPKELPQQGPMIMESTGLTLYTTILKWDDMTEKWNVLLKTQW